MVARLLHDPDDHSRIEVATAEIVHLRLPQNASTGYVWRLAELGEGLRVVGDTTVADDVSPGAAGWQELGLQAVLPGTWHLRLVRIRPWESTAAEVRHVTVAVT